jgi:peptide/nickel transport system substrate-binding protein
MALLPCMVLRPAGAQAPAPAATTVRIPFPRDDGSLTPYSFQLGYPLMTLVYDTLLWRDVNGTPQPWLARAIETSPDGTRFTLRLHPGLRWHDGAPLTAEDVRFTFRHVASHPSPRFSAGVAEVAGVTAPDPTTVVITTRRPAPGFPDQTLADLPILPAHLWQSLPAGQDSPPGLPVGSGPYRLVERLEGGGYRFEANPGYFKWAPTVGQIEVPIINDLGSMLSSFRRSAIDLIPLRLPPQEARAVDTITTNVARGPSYWGVQLVFNTRRPPFDDPAVRQAVAKSINLPALADRIGDAVPAEQGMLHPDSPWAPKQALKLTDEAGARATLARFTQQRVEVLSADNDPVHVEAAEETARALTGAGLTATAVTRPVAEVNKALATEGGTPDFSLAVTTIAPTSSYDPDYLNRIYGSATATTSGYSSQAFDRVAQRVATTVDPAVRRAAVTEELRLLATDVPALPLLFPNGAFAYRPSAHDGWQFVRGIGILDKQSFLGGPAGGAQPTTTTPTTASTSATSPPPTTTGGGGRLPFGIVPLALVAAAVVLIAVALVQRFR